MRERFLNFWLPYRREKELRFRLLIAFETLTNSASKILSRFSLCVVQFSLASMSKPAFGTVFRITGRLLEQPLESVAVTGGFFRFC